MYDGMRGKNDEEDMGFYTNMKEKKRIREERSEQGGERRSEK